jgi:ABC-2 type transport system ATP-binding protein
VLRERAAAGVAAVVATNEPVEAARWCDRVVFLQAGRTVLAGRPAELIARLGGRTRYEFSLSAARAPEIAVAGVEVALATAARLVAHAPDGTSPLPALCDAILRTGAAIDAVAVRRPDLGDVFLKATGSELSR